MLLAIDIGNTNIVVAIFDKDEIIHEWRIYSDSRRTGDEYFSILHSLFRDAKVDSLSCDRAVLSSVVPTLIGAFIFAVQKLTGKKPLLLTPLIFSKLDIKIPETALNSIGSDLVCNAVQAWHRFKNACIVVDFGTALTFMGIDCNANIVGTAIAPGIATSLKALCNNTAQLPTVPLDCPPFVLGQDTIRSMQAGLMYGYKCMTEGMVKEIKEYLSQKSKVDLGEIKVLATGGLNSVLEPLTHSFDIVDKNHTLKGLKLIAEKFC